MSRSGLRKLRARLALVAYFRKAFGVDAPTDPEEVRRYYDDLDDLPEGYNAEGRSYVYNFVAAKADTERLPHERLLAYDQNVKQHTESLNEHRREPITLKSFQILAALMTEAYLNRITEDPEGFRTDLNRFVEEQNAENKGRIRFPRFEPSDLNKLAYWMATGSGKTLLMHLNYYQYLHYANRGGQLPENILLVTPNEGLSRQHIEAMRESGITCRHFNAETVDLWGAGENPVKVIEIQKLVEDKTGSGLSIEVDAFEGRNLVFVDEGHKGTGSKAKTWRNRREALAEQGFTFEYSATFGQALGGAGTDIEEEYGRAILFDYSYPRFHEDGYGKDYRILNLKNAIDPSIRDRYLLANLLTYHEQMHVFEQDSKTLQRAYNIKQPLLVFIGHSVNATTQSDLGVNDERSLSDVEEVLSFLQRILENADEWVPDAIDQILAGEADLTRQDGTELFEDAFPVLREEGRSGQKIYEEMLESIFHVDGSTSLDLVDIRNADGEIGLRARQSDRYFGVINIGGDRVFLDRVGEADHDISIEEDEFTDSLFHAINQQESPVNLLLGSRKFIEGWDSWRVSTMGLMNFGRGEGPQVIQLFGRGVRLLGKDRSLKRSTELPGDDPQNLPLLETLNIFGVRADYMAQFREYLAEEGIETDPREIRRIPTEVHDELQEQGLLTIRARSTASFEDEVNLRLEGKDTVQPEVNLLPQLGQITSKDESDQDPSLAERDPRTIPEKLIPLLDWDSIYADLWRFRASRGYTNLVLDRATLRSILEHGLYTLYCSPDLLTPRKFEDLERVREIAVMVLRKYVEAFYKRERRRWEQDQVTYTPLDGEDAEDENLIDAYTVSVQAGADELVEEIEQVLESRDIYEGEVGLPSRVHFDRHLYLPLLVEETGAVGEKIDYSPPPLNRGERRLVEDLRTYLKTPAGEELLEDWEVFLIRNQSRGRGVGFLAGDQHDDRFYPDFILWLKSDTRQHIVFLEPHGLALEGDPLANHRVRFHDRIKEYEEQLGPVEGQTVSLHSYLISRSSFDELQSRARVASREGFHDAGIYFRDDGVHPILTDALD